MTDGFKSAFHSIWPQMENWKSPTTFHINIVVRRFSEGSLAFDKVINKILVIQDPNYSPLLYTFVSPATWIKPNFK